MNSELQKKYAQFGSNLTGPGSFVTEAELSGTLPSDRGAGLKVVLTELAADGKSLLSDSNAQRVSVLASGGQIVVTRPLATPGDEESR